MLKRNLGRERIIAIMAVLVLERRRMRRVWRNEGRENEEGEEGEGKRKSFDGRKVERRLDFRYEHKDGPLLKPNVIFHFY